MADVAGRMYCRQCSFLPVHTGKTTVRFFILLARLQKLQPTFRLILLLPRLCVVPASSVIPSATSKKLNIKDFFTGQVVRGQEEWLPVPPESPSLAVSGFALPSLIIFPVMCRCFFPVFSSSSLPDTLQLRLPSCGLPCVPSRPCSMESAGFRFDQTDVGATFDWVVTETYPAPFVAASAMSCRNSCRRKSIFSLPRTPLLSSAHSAFG